MSDNKFLNEENFDLMVKIVAKPISNWIPKFFRWIVKPEKIANNLVGFINEKADKIIPDNIDRFINAGLSAILKEDWEKANAALALIPTETFDLKALDQVEEKTLWTLVSKVIIFWLTSWVKSKKG